MRAYRIFKAEISLERVVIEPTHEVDIAVVHANFGALHAENHLINE